MATTSGLIMVNAESNLAELLNKADNGPVVLERDGKTYRLSREAAEEDIWADFDPARFRATIHEMAGSITKEEADRLKQVIYQGREAGTRPANRP